MPTSNQILNIKNLSVSFFDKKQVVSILNNIHMSVNKGEHMALIGETGCGKSILAFCILGLINTRSTITGKIIFGDSIDLINCSRSTLHKLRGKRIVFIPQNPMSYLNPVFNVKNQILDSVKKSGLYQKSEYSDIVLRVLSQVGFEDPNKIANYYPHQLSGGMAQRILLASGLTAKPDLVIADEPTKGLDFQQRDNFLSLTRDLFKNSAIILITHDLDVAMQCDNVNVMYAGELVEKGPTRILSSKPKHPYTNALIKAHPSNGMTPIPGSVPSFSHLPEGCRFHERCNLAQEKCAQDTPKWQFHQQQQVRCFYA